jgi:hypothetical protein
VLNNPLTRFADLSNPKTSRLADPAAAGKFSLSPISELGLLVVAPKAMDVTASGQIAYLGGVTWMEIPRDDTGFLQFLGEVLTLLEQPSPPEPGDKCQYCQYREHARLHGM